jgi:predicted O-methyltransferase YrrM
MTERSKTQRRIVLAKNMVSTSRNPMIALRAVRIARDALRRSAIQKLGELAPFLAFVLQHPPRTVVEIGTARGGMFYALCQVADRGATIVTVDLPEEVSSRVSLDPAGAPTYARPRQTVHVIKADAHDPRTARQVAELTGPIELLFIDGDHSYGGVQSHYKLWSPLVRPGGLIAFHDILPGYPQCEVGRLWGEVAGATRREIVDHGDLNPSHGGGIGILRV